MKRKTIVYFVEPFTIIIIFLNLNKKKARRNFCVMEEGKTYDFRSVKCRSALLIFLTELILCKSNQIH